METKVAKLRAFMAAGDHRAALRLAASWPRLGEHRVTIQRAAAAMLSPQAYQEMGFDAAALIAAGIAAIRERYRL